MNTYMKTAMAIVISGGIMMSVYALDNDSTAYETVRVEDIENELQQLDPDMLKVMPIPVSATEAGLDLDIDAFASLEEGEGASTNPIVLNGNTATESDIEEILKGYEDLEEGTDGAANPFADDNDAHMEEIMKGYENLEPGMLGSANPMADSSAIKNTADAPIKGVFGAFVMGALIALLHHIERM